MARPAYYNEFDPYAAEWLRNLIKAGHIPAGDVDDRSIKDVTAACLAGYGQCHFFAGIGGFGLAARLAGVPDDADLWTGGFPCQPFSVAGRQLAREDDRHLWPVLSRLIEQKRPAVFIGENVAGIIDLALDGVLFDLEASGYASRAFVVPACAVNAPHRRDRVWVAARSMEHVAGVGRGEGRAEHELRGGRPAATGAGVSHGAVADSDISAGQQDAGSSLGNEEADGRAGRKQRQPDGNHRSSGHGEGVSHGGAGDADGAGSQVGHGVPGDARQERPAVVGAGWRSPWDGRGHLPGADGKARRVKPGVRLLVNGLPGRVAKLRAGGNAIVPQVAAEVIRAAMRAL